MKKLFSILLLTIFILAGCSDLSVENNPIDESTSKNLTWLELPKSLEKEKSTELQAWHLNGRFINGNEGGVVAMNRSYYTVNGIVTVTASLEVSNDAFSGWKLIWYIIDDVYATTDFFPEMTFDIPCTYNLKIENADLSQFTSPDEIDFAYLDGERIELAEYGELIVDFDNNILEVKDALLPHFSRYGFVRKTD